MFGNSRGTRASCAWHGIVAGANPSHNRRRFRHPIRGVTASATFSRSTTRPRNRIPGLLGFTRRSARRCARRMRRSCGLTGWRRTSRPPSPRSGRRPGRLRWSQRKSPVTARLRSTARVEWIMGFGRGGGGVEGLAHFGHERDAAVEGSAARYTARLGTRVAPTRGVQK